MSLYNPRVERASAVVFILSFQSVSLLLKMFLQHKFKKTANRLQKANLCISNPLIALELTEKDFLRLSYTAVAILELLETMIISESGISSSALVVSAPVNSKFRLYKRVGAAN